MDKRPTLNIDGIMPGNGHAKPVAASPPAGPTHPQPTAASAQPIKPQYKAHLQPHPMLRRPISDIQPVMPAKPVQAIQPAVRPVRPDVIAPASSPSPRPATKLAGRELIPAPELELRPRPELPSRRSAARKRLAWNGSRKELAGIVVGGLLAALSVFSLQLGEIIIGVYAVLVLWKHIPSRFTFMLALGMFVGIIISQAVTPTSGIADNLAVYAFLLLCVGTLSLAREVRQDTAAA